MWPFKKKKEKKRTRVYNSAAINRLTNDWNSSGYNADAEIKIALATLRNRSRDLHRNNDYVRRYFNLLKTNVVGHSGITLKMNAVNSNGGPDKYANDALEREWKAWSKKGTCTVCGLYSFIDILKQVVECVARDGEVLIRHGISDNRHNYGLQILEADYLDPNLNKELPNGNKIVMGVEKNSQGKPVAYWILQRHPGSNSAESWVGNTHERISADEILHLYMIERPGQTRGVPWTATTGMRIKLLDGYEEAELVAARVGASTMGLFTSPDGDGYKGDDQDDETGEVVFDAEPGVFKQLPNGTTLETFDPNHPTTAFADFEKAILRGIASGLNVSYVTLANDLEGVSYSSIRQGELADRDNWRMIQTWMIEHFCQPVFQGWLSMVLLSGITGLPASKEEKFRATLWKPRGWTWVDPDKESKAAERDIRNGLASIYSVVAARGGDFEEVIAENSKGKTISESAGLKLPVFQEEKDNERTVAKTK